MITYATLTQFKDRLGIPAAETDSDARMLAALRHATAQIDRHTARRFAPAVQTRHYALQEAYSLRLDIDLLELLALTNGDGAAIPVETVQLLPEGDGPKHALMLSLSGGTLFVPGHVTLWPLVVRGIWGTHDAWSEAWRDSADTVQNAALGETGGTITVVDVTGADAAGISPRFQVGQLLRIGEEYLHVVGVDTSTHTLSVIRGVRGTTASSHAQGTAIEVYIPPLDVQALCLRWAAWLYQQVDAGIGGGADWLYPPEVPGDIYRLAASLRRARAA